MPPRLRKVDPARRGGSPPAFEVPPKRPSRRLKLRWVGRIRASPRRSILEIGVGMYAGLRAGLRNGLDRSLAVAPGGPWRVRLRGALVYRTPIGEWWWKATLTSGKGERRAFLVAPAEQDKTFLLDLIRSVVAGKLPVRTCAGCGEVLMPDAPPEPMRERPVRELCKTCSSRRPTRLPEL